MTVCRFARKEMTSFWLSSLDVAAGNLDRLPEDFVNIDHLARNLEFAPCQPGHVQEIVNETCLDLNVVRDHLQRLWRHRRQVLAAESICCHQEHRREWRAQLVRKNGHKVILSLLMRSRPLSTPDPFL